MVFIALGKEVGWGEGWGGGRFLITVVVIK